MSLLPEVYTDAALRELKESTAALEARIALLEHHVAEMRIEETSMGQILLNAVLLSVALFSAIMFSAAFYKTDGFTKLASPNAWTKPK